MQSEADKLRSQEIEAEAAKMLEEKNKKQLEFMKEALEKELAKFPEGDRGLLRTAYETPSDKRTEEQKALLLHSSFLQV